MLINSHSSNKATVDVLLKYALLIHVHVHVCIYVYDITLPLMPLVSARDSKYFYGLEFDKMCYIDKDLRS